MGLMAYHFVYTLFLLGYVTHLISTNTKAFVVHWVLGGSKVLVGTRINLHRLGFFVQTLMVSTILLWDTLARHRSKLLLVLLERNGGLLVHLSLMSVHPLR